MELAGDITPRDIKDILEAILDSNFWNEVSRCDCEVNINVDVDLTPTIDFKTHDNNFNVMVTTSAIREDDDIYGELLGWTFDADIVVNGVTLSMMSAGSISLARKQIERWSRIADLAARIAQLEFYPEDYFD